MPKYVIDPDFLAENRPVYTIIRAKNNGGKPKRVVLAASDVEITTTQGPGGPAQKVRVPAPTAAELKILFEQGCPYVKEAADAPQGGGGSAKP